MGESELVLDTLTVEEVLRIVGAQGKRAPAPARPAPADDWRQALIDADAHVRQAPARIPRADAPLPRAAPPAPPPSALPALPAPPPLASATKLSDLAPPGLVVGGVETELFGGPIARASSLAEIAEMVRTCTRCPLYATAINPVPGEGSPTAQLMCIGEAPGATEDETGRPFVGQAGKLLTDILRRSEER